MMIQSKERPACASRRGLAGHRRGLRAVPAGQRRRCAAGAILAAALLAAGCTGHAARGGVPRSQRPAGAAASSLVRVPRPDYADPASVAAAFYTAWGSVDAVHDGPAAFAARCRPLATRPLEAQLASGQPATVAWQAMRRARMVSLVAVRAVTQPDGAPPPGPSVAYLRVYATRVTVSSAGRTVASDGVTLRVTRPGGRWLVSAVLFY